MMKHIAKIRKMKECSLLLSGRKRYTECVKISKIKQSVLLYYHIDASTHELPPSSLPKP